MPGRPASDGLIGRLLVMWAGLAIGVAFVATPAKLLAPSGLHGAYIGAEALKIAALLLGGLVPLKPRT